jgi:hypothetical protein
MMHYTRSADTFYHRLSHGMKTISWTVISALAVLLYAIPASGEEKTTFPLHVIPLDAQNIAWITLTDKLEVVIAFKEPIEEIHSAMWKKAGDIDAALRFVELVRNTVVQSLEINTKDALSIRENQRCKVRCEIVGLRFAPAR